MYPTQEEALILIDPNTTKKSFTLSLKQILDLEEKRKLPLKPLFDISQINLNEKEVSHSTVIRPQFALAGYLEYFTEKSIVILGKTEANFLKQFDLDKQSEIIGKISKFNIPCVIITNNNQDMFDPKIIDIFISNKIPVFTVGLPTPVLLHRLMDILDDFFCLKTSIHGNLVEVFGVGILILGNSGIGKSELTLDLLEKGHRFVADDIVVIMRKWGHKLLGYGGLKSQKWIEIRGAGLFDVTQMYGANCAVNIVEIEKIIFLYNNEFMIESIKDFLKEQIKNKKIDININEMRKEDLFNLFITFSDEDLKYNDLKIYKRIIKTYPPDRVKGGSFVGKIFEIEIEIHPINIDLSKDNSVIVEAIASRVNTLKVGFKLPLEEGVKRQSSAENIYIPPNWTTEA